MQGNDPDLVDRIADLESKIIEGDASEPEMAEYREYVRIHQEWVQDQPWFQAWEKWFESYLKDEANLKDANG
jgi:hypothetical protein